MSTNGAPRQDSESDSIQMMESVSREEPSPEPDSDILRYRDSSPIPIPRIDEDVSIDDQNYRRSNRSPPALLESEYRGDEINESSLFNPWNRDPNAFHDEEDPTVIDLIKAFIEKCCCCFTKFPCCNLPPPERGVEKEYLSEQRWMDETRVSDLKPAFSDRSSKKDRYQSRVTFNNGMDHDIDVHSVENGNEEVQPLEEHLLKNGVKAHEITRPRSLTLKQIHDKMARMRCYCIPCINYKFYIGQLVGISFLIQVLVLLTVGCVELTENHLLHWEARLAGKFFLGVFWVIQVTVKVQLMLICVRRLWHLTFSEIIQLYLTSLLIFTGVYVTAYFFDESYNDDDSSPFQAFNIDDTQWSDANYWERLVAFLYFSTSQQTLCGVCEIIPKSPPTMLLAGLQMSYGIFFSLVIISIGISRLGEDLEARTVEREKMQNEKEEEKKMSSILPLRTSYDNLIPTTCWYDFTHHPTIIKIRRQTRKFLLPLVIAVQLAKNCLEWQTSDSSFAQNHPVIHTMFFVLFDVINVMAVIATSLKFIQLGHMTELRLSFLCQTYSSCVLIFTGFYADLQVSYGPSDYADAAFLTGEDTYMGMWVKFCYFSFACMTLCGAGLDVRPKTWYAALAEMLLGLFFHVYIFGIGLLLLANKKANSRPPDSNRRRRSSSVLSRERSASVTYPVGSELIMSTLLETKTSDLL